MLAQALGVLSAREHSVFHRRRLKEPPDTLETVSQELGVSRERVRQIENSAFEKVRAFIVLHVDDSGEKGTKGGQKAQKLFILFWFAP